MKFLLRILSLLLLFFLLRNILKSIFAPRPSNRQAAEPEPFSGPRKIREGRMEKDPICGTYVDVASSLNLSRGGETHYFCSSECLEKYKKQ
jgi:YHS domain-containing protein